MTDARGIVIDETSLKREQDYVTIVHDLNSVELLRLFLKTPHQDIRPLLAYVDA